MRLADRSERANLPGSTPPDPPPLRTRGPASPTPATSGHRSGAAGRHEAWGGEAARIRGEARLYAACWLRILPALQRGEIAASVAVERKRRRELKQRWRRAEAEGSRPEEEAATTMSRLPMRSAVAAGRGGLTGRSRAESMRISMRARREEVGEEEEAPEGGYVRFAGRRVISRRLSLQLGGVVGLSALAGVAARVAEARQRREGDL